MDTEVLADYVEDTIRHIDATRKSRIWGIGEPPDLLNTLCEAQKVLSELSGQLVLYDAWLDREAALDARHKDQEIERGRLR